MATILGSRQKIYPVSIRKDGKEVKKCNVVAPNKDAVLSKLRNEYRGKAGITWHVYKSK